MNTADSTIGQERTRQDKRLLKTDMRLRARGFASKMPAGRDRRIAEARSRLRHLTGK
jgi:hypothetical protein